MARMARCLLDGGYYHILTRGLDRRRLFRCRQDFEYFLKLMRACRDKYMNFIIHYCLMPNHIHLLLKMRNGKDLSKFMQSLLQVYAVSYRKKYGSAGFIFQNRYKSKLIDNDAYLMECARYIERNPLRAKIIDKLEEYPWSSYHYYSRGKADNLINLNNPLYESLGQTAEDRRKSYAKYILQERLYEHIVDQAFRIG
ncbi:MAG: transposase [Candidatus Omnitrophica bacterium]|nr:transposase [Candidatus Omnitrophota bacterium]